LARSQQAPLGALRSIFERRSDARSGLLANDFASRLAPTSDTARNIPEHTLMRSAIIAILVSVCSGIAIDAHVLPFLTPCRG
ncbi:hypothetical protein ACQKDL_00640, partial [Pseudomonas bubulae]|uniref:hypothetical protein n=1 Tax=Pseudomonas bubulae TaxID=2316085 RepID=UPI003D09405B